MNRNYSSSNKILSGLGQHFVSSLYFLARYLRLKLAILLFGSMLVCSFILSSCGSRTDSETAKEEKEVLANDVAELTADQAKMAGIVMGSVEMRTLSNLIKINGMISTPPQNIATISAPLGGFIKSTSLLQGSAVKKNQVLAMIENPEFIELQQSFLESRSQLEYIEADYNRQKDLNKEKISSVKNFQQITSEYKQLKTKVSALTQKLAIIGIDPKSISENKILRAIPIFSPIDGYVKQVNINIGKYVSPTDVLFEIMNTSHLTVELTVFEKDIHEISIGQQLRFGLSDEGKDQYMAKIYQVGKILNTDKTVKVYGHISNPSTRLIPGIYVTANVETSDNMVTALPSEAIVQYDGKDYIFIYDRVKTENGKKVTEYKMLQVKRGVTDNGYSEVVLPVNFDKKKSKVVIKGAYTILTGKKNAGDMSC